ncbi:Mov34/MPN/PAD-1 family protein [Salmonella enterica subsp. enterica serovar Newport]|nr:hypothetical protein [Salmonella enterica]
MNDPNLITINTINFRVSIPKEVSDIWLSYRQNRPMDPEAFGVLIGNKDLGIEHYHLVEVTVPQNGDRCSRLSFTLQDPEHQRTVDHLHQRSSGQLIYLGTWHTHPEKVPHASYTDIRDWKECKSRNNERQLFFVIIGTEQNALYYFVEENLLRQEF